LAKELVAKEAKI